MKLTVLTITWFALAISVCGQAAPEKAAAPDLHVDVYSAAVTHDHAQPLIDQARKSTEGVATSILQHYPDHYTMMAVRVKDGRTEVHQHFADVFIIVSGAATLTTGGTVVNPQTASEGEIRGDGIANGDAQPLAAGSIVHIPAGVPHMVKMASDEPFVYYVVKVKQP